MIKQNFSINYKYNIHFTKNVFNITNNILLNELINENLKKKNVLIILDKNIIKFHKNIVKKIELYCLYHSNKINLVCKPIKLTGGERIKNHYSIVKYFYKKIEEYKICRQSFIIAIGGGTLLDLAGYIASTSHRGVKLIRIPTTVLSQDDSGVGVKNGINYANKKNFIGCFNTPYAVINDYTFLKSLKKKQIKEGLSEAIKVALIKDKNFFSYIYKNSKNITKKKYILEYIIRKCAKLHAEHISNYGDPFENLSSRPLDFGHWVAHKLESLSKYKITHGLAVAIGIAIDSTYSYKLNLIKKNDWKFIIKTLKNIGFNLYVNELDVKENNELSIFNGLTEFKEHLGGKLTITLLKDIGKKIDVHHVNKKIYIESIKLIKKIK